MKKLVRRYIESLRNTYEGTERGLEYCLWLCIATVLSLCATDITDVILTKAAIFSAVFVIITFLFFLAKKLLKWVLRLTRRSYLYNDSLHILLYALILYLLNQEYYNVEFGYLPCIAFVMALAFIKFSKSLYAMYVLKRDGLRLYLTFAISAILTILIVIFFMGPGFKDEYTVTKDFEAVENGSLKVAYVDYGMEGENAELESGTTDLSIFAGYDGVVKFVREKLFGYSIQAAELKGRVWYPEEGGDYPVMFIVHGNHMMTTKSHLGYDYLGSYLASYGYVVVSVDETLLNGFINGGVRGENDARAVLLLENMKQLQRFNEDENCVLYNKMDFENICLAGHSRGGEAAAIATFFNGFDTYPDNSNIKFRYNFNIKSVIAIAPVCDQYKPAGQDLELTDVSYLLIHGSNDQDVSVMAGEKQYENLEFSGEKDCFKAYIYVLSANHGQFNSEWGRYDKTYPDRLLLNTANLLEEAAQQEILKVSVKNFLDATLKGENGARKFFIDCTDSGLPDTVYIQAYEESNSLIIADFEEDADTLTGTLEDVMLAAGGVSLFGGMSMDFSIGHDDRENASLHLMWYAEEDNYPDLQVSIKDEIAVRRFLSFEAVDLSSELYDEDYEQPKIKVDLYDAHNNKVTVDAGDFSTIYPGLAVRQFKLQYLTGTYDIKERLQTVYIPAEAFEAASAEADDKIDLERITKIIFRFDGSKAGNLAIDNIRTGE